MRVRPRFFFFLLPLLIAAFLVLLDASRILVRPQGMLYDLLLSVRAPLKLDPNILLVDVDDEATRLAGAWPWTRDFIADGLVVLKEMNARSAVVDVPLAQRSAPALDASALRQVLPAALDKEFLQIQANIQTLYDAIRHGSVRPQDSARYVNDLVGLVAMAKVRLFNTATGIERDDDALLGQALGFFGNAYVPFDLLSTPDIQPNGASLSLTAQRQAIAATIRGRDPFPTTGGIRPAVLPAVKGSHGGGFAGIVSDPDGVFRSAPFMIQWQGMHFVPVAAAAAFDALGNPDILISEGRVIMGKPATPGGSRSPAVGLPIDAHGRILLSWSRANGGDGFRHLSWARLIQYSQSESALIDSLKTMDEMGYLSYLRSDTSILDVYEQSERLRNEMLAAGITTYDEEWVTLRSQFFALCSQFLDGDAESRIRADIDTALAGLDPADSSAQRMQVQRAKLDAAFALARSQLDTVSGARSSLQAVIPGSICIISLSGEAYPAAMGKTPFGAAATEATAEAALVNTILTGSNLSSMPVWIGYLIAGVLVLIIAMTTYRLRPGRALLLGIAWTLLCTAVLGGIFLLWGDFIQPAVPIIAGFAWSLTGSLFLVGAGRRETLAVRTAFGGRLSEEGLRSVLLSPEPLTPQGARRNVTIVALAEKGLSGGSTAHEPRDVLRRIAAYHSAVGEVVRSLDGMIGGAGVERLTAYFGTPLILEDHTARACRAACRVRAVERELNVAASPPLATRMGIDTGECIVGDLGSRGMPGYSVVGAPADWAARLEGLNGTFGTSILITERVRAAIGEAFLVRRVGIARIADPEASVRVYELVAEAGSSEQVTTEAVEAFEQGLQRFEERDFVAALALFSRVKKLLPDDGPAQAYAERCRHLMAASGRAATSFPT